MKAAQSRPSIGLLLSEVFLIVVGVLLGLFGNEMRLEQREQRRTEMALEQISEEIRDNQSQIDRIHPHHFVVRDSLNALMSRTLPTESPVSLQELWRSMSGGFGVASLRQNAWKLANSMGAIEHMDYGTASLLSRLYDLQEFYTDKYSRLSDNLYLAANVDPGVRQGLIFALAVLTNDIVIHEEDLKLFYERVLEHLEAVE
jgi:hypothetical protein